MLGGATIFSLSNCSRQTISPHSGTNRLIEKTRYHNKNERIKQNEKQKEITNNTKLLKLHVLDIEVSVKEEEEEKG